MREHGIDHATRIDAPRRWAHGGITQIARCKCGAVRRMNINGGRRESSGWRHPSEDGLGRRRLGE